MEKNKLLILFSLWIPSLMNHHDLENARGFHLWAKGYTVSSMLAPMLCPTPFLIHTRLTWSIVSWPNDVSISPTTYTSSVESSLPCYYVLSHFVHSLLVILKSQTLMTYEKNYNSNGRDWFMVPHYVLQQLHNIGDVNPFSRADMFSTSLEVFSHPKKL